MVFADFLTKHPSPSSEPTTLPHHSGEQTVSSPTTARRSVWESVTESLLASFMLIFTLFFAGGTLYIMFFFYAYATSLSWGDTIFACFIVAVVGFLDLLFIFVTVRVLWRISGYYYPLVIFLGGVWGKVFQLVLVNML